ncbi:OmpA family protein [Halovulum sp. GXIMD14793]
MRTTAVVFAVAALFGSAGLAALSARGAVGAFETMTEEQVVTALKDVDSKWTTVTVDGLIVNLYGRAPSERDRFAVLEALSASFAGNRIKDQSILAGEDSHSVPSFSMEILRNGSSVSLIGQAPKGAGAGIVADRLDGVADLAITDMLEMRDFSVPGGWRESLDFALRAMTKFQNGNAAITPGKVRLFAVAQTAESAEDLREELERLQPSGIEVEVQIDAPLPTIAPFDFAVTVDGTTAELTRCAAPSEAAAQKLQDALAPWNLTTTGCRLGLGAPGPKWTASVVQALKALETLGGGSLRVENADIHLTALPGTDETTYTRATTVLAAALPELYTLHATLPAEPVAAPVVEELPPPQLIATRGEDGSVTLRGDLPDRTLSEAAQAIARAHFGFDSVISDTTRREDLPSGWSARVLAGVEALALLNVGEATITETSVRISGEAQTDDVEPALRMLLQARLAGQGVVQTAITVNPREETGAVSEQRAELCEQQIAAIFVTNQIQFPPGATEIDTQSEGIVDAVVTVLKDCPGARFEIGGHTDSQGRESSNLAISQARASKVLDALLERGVDQVFLTAKGYGETLPVADNDTEAGRAANRRIEFRLIRDGEEQGAEGSGEVMLAGEDEDTAEEVADATDQTTETEDQDDEGQATDDQTAAASDADAETTDDTSTEPGGEDSAVAAEADSEDGDSDVAATEDAANDEPPVSESATPSATDGEGSEAEAPSPAPTESTTPSATEDSDDTETAVETETDDGDDTEAGTDGQLRPRPRDLEEVTNE